MNDERFLYEIRPNKPITNLIEGQTIRRPSTMQLTKEEALKCMHCGSVWRRFVGMSPQRVTGNNLDRMHRKHYLSEEDYNEFLEKSKSPVEMLAAAKKENEPVSVEKVIEEHEVVEEVLEEKPEEVEESTTTEEVVAEEAEDQSFLPESEEESFVPSSDEKPESDDVESSYNVSDETVESENEESEMVSEESTGEPVLEASSPKKANTVKINTGKRKKKK